MLKSFFRSLGVELGLVSAVQEPPATEAPLAQTIPPEWLAPPASDTPSPVGREAVGQTPPTEVRVTVSVDRMSDAKVMAALGTLRAQSTTRLGPNTVRTVQHGENMSQVRKKRDPILSTDNFSGQSLVDLMRR